MNFFALLAALFAWSEASEFPTPVKDAAAAIGKVAEAISNGASAVETVSGNLVLAVQWGVIGLIAAIIVAAIVRPVIQWALEKWK